MSNFQIFLLVITPFFTLFAIVVLFGAPYFPSKRANLVRVAKRLNMQPGQRLVDFGSGDGIVLKHLEQFGLKMVGIELNPLLVLFSRIRLRRNKHTKVIWKNMWEYHIPADTDYVYTFLHTRFMKRFDKKLQRELRRPTIVISFAFEIPEREPLFEESGYFVYRYDPKDLS